MGGAGWGVLMWRTSRRGLEFRLGLLAVQAATQPWSADPLPGRYPYGITTVQRGVVHDDDPWSYEVTHGSPSARHDAAVPKRRGRHDPACRGRRRAALQLQDSSADEVVVTVDKPALLLGVGLASTTDGSMTADVEVFEVDSSDFSLQAGTPRAARAGTQARTLAGTHAHTLERRRAHAR